MLDHDIWGTLPCGFFSGFVFPRAAWNVTGESLCLWRRMLLAVQEWGKQVCMSCIHTEVDADSERSPEADVWDVVTCLWKSGTFEPYPKFINCVRHPWCFLTCKMGETMQILRFSTHNSFSGTYPVDAWYMVDTSKNGTFILKNGIFFFFNAFCLLLVYWYSVF